MVMKVKREWPTNRIDLIFDSCSIVESENDPYIELAERGLVAVTEALGFFVVNYIPLCTLLDLITDTQTHE